MVCTGRAARLSIGRRGGGRPGPLPSQFPIDIKGRAPRAAVPGSGRAPHRGILAVCISFFGGGPPLLTPQFRLRAWQLSSSRTWVCRRFRGSVPSPFWGGRRGAYFQLIEDLGHPRCTNRWGEQSLLLSYLVSWGWGGGAAAECLFRVLVPRCPPGDPKSWREGSAGLSLLFPRWLPAFLLPEGGVCLYVLPLVALSVPCGVQLSNLLVSGASRCSRSAQSWALHQRLQLGCSALVMMDMD